MNKTAKELIKINTAIKMRKTNINLTISKKTIAILNFLVDYNLIEFKINEFFINVTIKYSFNKPSFEKITYMGSKGCNLLSLKKSNAELNNKYALYIISTSKGLGCLNASSYNEVGGFVIFKINI